MVSYIHPVNGSGYLPHNISVETSLLWVYCEWSQKLMSWYFCSFFSKLIYWINISFSHHICSWSIVFNPVIWFVDHNSQMARFLMWYILIVGYYLKELLRKWSCILGNDSIWYIGEIAGAFFILIEERFPSHISLFLRRLSSENNLQMDLGRGHYYSSARYLINSSSPISGWITYQSYNLQTFINEIETILVVFLPTIYISSTKSYCIRNINYLLSQFYKDMDIYSILYHNQHG